MSDNNNNNNLDNQEKKVEEIKEVEKKEVEEKKEKEEKEGKEEEKKEEEINEEEIKEPLGDKVSILYYLENPYLNYNIESPRSIDAMTQLGFIMDDLLFLSFPDFINNNPNLRSLPKEMQLKRYEFAEQFRLAKIQKIKELRDELIEQEKMNKENGTETNTNINGNNEINDNNNNIEEISSTAINEEIRQFERMKRKNEMDLMNAVEFELKRQIMIKEGEAKIRRQNIKNDNFKKTMEIKNEIEKKEKEERERRREEKRMEEEEKLRRENLIKYEKEQQRLKLEELKEIERLKENMEKHIIQEERRLAFK